LSDDASQIAHVVTVTNNGPDAVGNVKFGISFANGVVPTGVVTTTDALGNCSQLVTPTSNQFFCSTGAMAAEATVTFKYPTTTNVDVVNSNPPNISPAQFAASMGPGENPAINPGSTTPLLNAASTASITGESGVWDPETSDKFAFLIVEKPWQQIQVLIQTPTCKNKNLGHLGALLGVDCKSPINEVINLGTALAAVASAGIGNATLALIVYYTVQVVAVCIEDTAIVTAV
jgi:hypothetical protein